MKIIVVGMFLNFLKAQPSCFSQTPVFGIKGNGTL